MALCISCELLTYAKQSVSVASRAAEPTAQLRKTCASVSRIGLGHGRGLLRGWPRAGAWPGMGYGRALGMACDRAQAAAQRGSERALAEDGQGYAGIRRGDRRRIGRALPGGWWLGYGCLGDYSIFK